MMKSTTLFITVALLAALLLSACNPVVAPGTTEPAADAEPAAAEAQAAAVAALSALPWQWVQVSGPDGDSTVETPEAYTLLFNADGTLAVTTACEQRGGTYAVEGTALTISLDAADGAACPDDAPGAQLVQLVGEAGQFFALGDTLVIVLADGASTLSFKPDVTTVLDLCGAGAAALNPIEATLPPAVSAGLDAALLTFLDAGARSAPGVAMLVITPAGRYFKAAGVADVTTCAPLAADIPYEIGSNTKLMTSAMILQLQEEGALAIDDPIADYLPELAATLPYGDAITIDMLLRHTSGLYDYFDVEGDGGPIADGTKDKAMLTRAFTPEELVQRVAAAGESYFAPEEAGRFHYSNTGYILLGLIIEKVTGKTYAENLQARILDPLGLTQTFLLEGQPAAGLLPRAYYSTPFAYTTDEWNASQGWSAGAVVSTAEEFARFLKALFTGQLFQDAATLDLMRGHSDAGVDALGSGMTYGRGMLDIQGVLGHGGQTLGFQSDGGYIPDQDVTIVMWSNAAMSNVSRTIVPAIAGVVAEAGQAALPRFEPLEECFAQLPEEADFTLDMDCGYVVVPEFYNGESSREVKLGITRLNSGQGTASSPLFMLAGGPGQTQVSPDFLRIFNPALLGGILQGRDIVLVEQRGTEYTDTWLDCTDLNAASWTAYEQGLTGDEADALGIEIVQRCIDDFKAQGVNFDAYNSVENAADVNAVREALGYDKIIYYGASYGSQLGQHIMRDFPDILEAVVLDGAEGLSRKSWVENRALDAQWGIDHLTALCEADEKCIATYDIPALVDAALALFDNGPLPYTYTDPADPSLTVEGEVTVQDMIGLIYGQQGDRIGAMSLPATLAQLTEGGAEVTAEILGSIQASNLIASRDATAGPMALLMHMAMVCSDDPVKSIDEVNVQGVGQYAKLFGQVNAEQYVQFCSLIDVQDLPDSTDVSVTTDVPALLLSGDLDVATPTFRSQEVADALPDSTLVVFPGRTHVQIGGINICAAQVMTQFVLDPTAPVDTSCTETSPLLGFLLPDGSMSQDTP